MAKSDAQRSREYRERLREKLAESDNEIHEKPKTNHERHVRHTAKKPMSVAERVQNYRARQKCAFGCDFLGWHCHLLPVLVHPQALVNEIMPKKKTSLSPITRHFRRLHARKRLTEGSSEQEGGKPCNYREQVCSLELRISYMEQLLEVVLAQLEAEKPCPAQLTPTCSEVETVIVGQPGTLVPLNEAAEIGDTVALVRALVRGADPNVLDRFGDTALHCAVRSEEVLPVELLLASGASLDAQNARGTTPLADAVCCGHQRAVEILLENGAQLERRDQDGRTPLMHAVVLRNTQMVSLLVKHGAVVNVLDCNRQSPLVTAARDCSIDILTLLVCHSTPCTAQMEEAMNVAGSSAALMILVQEMHMSATCSVKSGLLGRVSKEGWLRAVTTILNNCVDRKCQRNFHYQNIQCAILVAKTEDILHVLWKSAPNTTLQEAMSRAAAMGWTTALEAIVSFWKNRNTRVCSEIENALHIVTTPEAALLLVQAHPCIARTSIGREIAWRAAEHKWYKILEALINNGVPVNSRWNGSPLLNCAASRGNTECVLMLMSRGASFRVKDDHGRTPLYCAAKAGHRYIVDILLKKGANPTIKDPFGLMPYDVATSEDIRNLLKPVPWFNTETKVQNLK